MHEKKSERGNAMGSGSIEVLGLGYCGLDFSCLLPRIPIDDKVEALATLIQGGGPSATAACAAGRLGAKTAFLGAVGDDSRGTAILEAFKADNVDASRVAIRKGAESPSAFCWTDAEGKRSIAWTRGSVKPLEASEVSEELVASGKVLHLDGHQTAAAIQAAKFARKHGVTVSIDAGTVVPGIEELLELSDIVIASEKFIERQLKTSDPVEAVKRLFGPNCRFAGVTLGSEGSYGYDGKSILRQDSFKVDVVDTTGAGDTYHGAFVYKYVKGGSWQDCMKFAAAVAAMKCRAFGGRSGIPKLADAEAFLNERS